jgi:hypothetical protein
LSTPLAAEQQQLQQLQQPQAATAEATKEVLDAFLTRDSRNSFIGR